MTTGTTHALLAVAFCYLSLIVTCTSSLRLIGLLHGPSDEKYALDEQRRVQAEILALSEKYEDDWPWNDGESSESVLSLYRDLVDDPLTLLLHDAGAIASMLAMILVLVPKFFSSTSYSAIRRFYFLLLAFPLCIAPGMIAQVVIQKRVPIEILLVGSWRSTKGLAYSGYCSLQSLLLGLEGDDISSALTTIHDLKVVGLAGLLVFLILGMFPPGK